MYTHKNICDVYLYLQQFPVGTPYHCHSFEASDLGGGEVGDAARSRGGPRSLGNPILPRHVTGGGSGSGAQRLMELMRGPKKFPWLSQQKWGKYMILLKNNYMNVVC